jgi:hypothetical protein
MLNRVKMKRIVLAALCAVGVAQTSYAGIYLSPEEHKEVTGPKLSPSSGSAQPDTSATPSTKPKAKPAKKDSNTVATVVTEPEQADATHIYFDPKFEDLPGEFKENPKLCSIGWRDGWHWASKQTDLTSVKAREREESCEKTLYPDTKEFGNDTRVLAFDCAFYFWKDKALNQRIADAGPAPQIDTWYGCPGGHFTVDAIKQKLSDPESFQIGDKYLTPFVSTYQNKPCWETRILFRAKNQYGGLVMMSAIVYFTGGEVSQTKILGVEIEQ